MFWQHFYNAVNPETALPSECEAFEQIIPTFHTEYKVFYTDNTPVVLYDSLGIEIEAYDFDGNVVNLLNYIEDTDWRRNVSSRGVVKYLNNKEVNNTEETELQKTVRELDALYTQGLGTLNCVLTHKGSIYILFELIENWRADKLLELEDDILSYLVVGISPGQSTVYDIIDVRESNLALLRLYKNPQTKGVRIKPTSLYAYVESQRQIRITGYDNLILLKNTPIDFTVFGNFLADSFNTTVEEMMKREEYAQALSNFVSDTTLPLLVHGIGTYYRAINAIFLYLTHGGIKRKSSTDTELLKFLSCLFRGKSVLTFEAVIDTALNNVRLLNS